MEKVKKFVSGELYINTVDIDRGELFKTIPKGTVLAFEAPNLGFARFVVHYYTDFERLELKSPVVSLRPKLAFKIMVKNTR